MTARDWQADLDQRLSRYQGAIDAEKRAAQDAAYAEKRRQIREPVEPLRPDDFAWWSPWLALGAILVILQLWEELQP